MRDENKVTVRGRLAFDSEFHEDPKRTHFAVLTNIPFSSKNGDAGRETTLHRVIAWNEDLSALKKGDSVKLTGMVTLRENDRGELVYRVILDEITRTHEV